MNIKKEADRLLESLEKFAFTWEDCAKIAPVTLKINQLKKAKHAIILAHSYQTADIIYGVADFVGDSYGLSKEAQTTGADIILFSSVYFMAETAKILNPNKRVFVPKKADCSLADSITVDDVRKLRQQYPEAALVAYINTNADIKAEIDVCVTSGNVYKIIEALPEKEIVFLPDRLMGENVQKKSQKKIHLWNGVCTVHEAFSSKELKLIKTRFPQAKILAHPECDQSVLREADFTGSTEQLLSFVKQSSDKDFAILTECGLVDRLKKEQSDKNFLGSCHLCPYMKKITLLDIWQTLENLPADREVFLSPAIIKKAKQSLDRMFALTEEKNIKRPANKENRRLPNR